MMLDLIDSLEQQQHMAIANIPPQKSTLQQLTRQRDLRLQSRAHQLRVGTRLTSSLFELVSLLLQAAR